jgi:prepilin-type N-terminal cleavage/methylation domain-containing protein
MTTTFSCGSIPRSASGPSTSTRSGFSLVELLMVLAVMSIVTAMSVPMISSIRDSQNVTAATFSVSSALQRARTYAMAHNTYVWVGFYEEAAYTTTPTNVFPYTGAGQVVIGMAASVDGTQIYANSSSTGTQTLQAPAVMPIEKLLKVENVHVTDLGLPSGTGSAINLRPNGAYAGMSSEQYGIDSDNSQEASHELVLDGYTFYKTIRFSPSGEASINDSASLRRVGEIDLRPTHGTQVNASTPNVAAIQFSGIEGAIQTYRN